MSGATRKPQVGELTISPRIQVLVEVAFRYQGGPFAEGESLTRHGVQRGSIHLVASPADLVAALEDVEDRMARGVLAMVENLAEASR
jgi:hypothetical protein